MTSQGSDKKQLHCYLWHATSCLNQPQYDKCDTSFGKKKKDMMGPGKVSSLNLVFILAHLEQKEWIRIDR